MHLQAAALFCLLLPCGQSDGPPAVPAPEGVVVYSLPNEDLTVMFSEAAGGMAVAFKTRSGDWFEAHRMYIGDGELAVPIEANNSGIWLQGTRRLYQGQKLPNGTLLKIQKGYKQLGQLKRGDVYMILSGVTFIEPGMLEAEWVGVDAAGRRISLSLAADKSVRYSIGTDVREGRYSIGWYKRGPCYLDLDFGDRGKLQTIMAPNHQRLRIELNEVGEQRPAKFTRKAVVLAKQPATE